MGFIVCSSRIAGSPLNAATSYITASTDLARRDAIRDPPNPKTISRHMNTLYRRILVMPEKTVKQIFAPARCSYAGRATWSGGGLSDYPESTQSNRNGSGFRGELLASPADEAGASDRTEIRPVAGSGSFARRPRRLVTGGAKPCFSLKRVNFRAMRRR